MALKRTLEEMKQFEEAVSVASMSNEEYAQYERSLKNYRDRVGTLRYYQRRINRGIEEGREKGREKGRAEGLAEGRAEMVRKMVAKGMSLELVADVSGLSLEKVREIVG